MANPKWRFLEARQNLRWSLFRPLLTLQTNPLLTTQTFCYPKSNRYAEQLCCWLNCVHVIHMLHPFNFQDGARSVSGDNVWLDAIPRAHYEVP